MRLPTLWLRWLFIPFLLLVCVNFVPLLARGTGRFGSISSPLKQSLGLGPRVWLNMYVLYEDAVVLRVTRLYLKEVLRKFKVCMKTKKESLQELHIKNENSYFHL